MKKTLFFIFLLLCSLSVPAQSPPLLTGNWINASSNEWEYGFFEDFAIYQTDFWDYESINTKRNKTKITLRNGNQTVQLEISPGKKGELRIKKGSEKAEVFRKMGKVYPRYSRYDGTAFPEPLFMPDSAVIMGYYRNFDRIPDRLKARNGYRNIEFDIEDFITGKAITHQTTIDSLGRFQITVPLLNTQEVFADWERLNRKVVLQPGDRLFIFADMDDIQRPEDDAGREAWYNKDKEILCMGTHARLNNELIQYKPYPIHIDFSKEWKNGRKGMEYLQYCEEHNKKKEAYFNQYVAEYPAVSERFRFYITAISRYEFARDLMQRRFNLNLRNKEPLPEAYMEYVTQHFPLNDPQVYTLTREFISFLRDYMGYIQNMNPVSANRIMTQELNREAMDRIEEQQFQKVDSILGDYPILTELWSANTYFKKFDYTKLPLVPSAMNRLNERIRNPYLRERLISLNNHYTKLNERKFDESSLKDTRHLNDVSDVEQLFAQLIAPYRGKVIYVDIWGTWCSPCIDNIKLLPDIKKELDGKDVVYMYLANDSPEQAWRNTIKELGITGENVVHYRLPDQQQKKLEQHFSIRFYPTYMIIGRQGEIISADAPEPRRKDNLLKEINKALEITYPPA